MLIKNMDQDRTPAVFFCVSHLMWISVRTHLVAPAYSALRADTDCLSAYSGRRACHYSTLQRHGGIAGATLGRLRDLAIL